MSMQNEAVGRPQNVILVGQNAVPGPHSRFGYLSMELTPSNTLGDAWKSAKSPLVTVNFDLSSCLSVVLREGFKKWM